jgi:hypothetical protein
LVPVLTLAALADQPTTLSMLLPVASVSYAIWVGLLVPPYLPFISSSIVAPVVIGLAVKLAAAEEAG